MELLFELVKDRRSSLEVKKTCADGNPIREIESFAVFPSLDEYISLRGYINGQGVQNCADWTERKKGDCRGSQ